MQKQDVDVDASVSISMVALTAFLGQLTTSLLGPNVSPTQTTIPSPLSQKVDALCNSTSGAEVSCDWTCEGSATSISQYNQTTRECFENCVSQVSRHSLRLQSYSIEKCLKRLYFQDTCLQSTIQNYKNVSISLTRPNFD